MDHNFVLWIVVGTALAFDFTNGFHDTANAVATSISTRALSPRLAVTLAAMVMPECPSTVNDSQDCLTTIPRST